MGGPWAREFGRSGNCSSELGNSSISTTLTGNSSLTNAGAFERIFGTYIGHELEGLPPSMSLASAPGPFCLGSKPSTKKGSLSFRAGRGHRSSVQDPARLIRVTTSSRSADFLSSSSCFASTSATFSPPQAGSPRLLPDSNSAAPTYPTTAQLLAHPVAAFHYVHKDVALFVAGAFAGAMAKSITAPLDRVKLLMQVRGVQAAKEVSGKAPGLVEAFVKIFKEDGLMGYWKGNTPQVLRIIPYSAVQLFAYESYKRILKGNNAELSVPARLTAGACAGMTSTLVTYPLDVLRLRLAVDSASKSMSTVAFAMLKEEGIGSFYKGLGPSLLSIAPYIAINFCVFDLIKKSMPPDFRKKPIASFITALAASTVATLTCYPLDTVRRQLQMKGTPYTTVFDAFPGILKRDGVIGLYRGFLANALKNLPNSSIRLTTYDAAKNLIVLSKGEFDKLVAERQGKEHKVNSGDISI